MSNFNWIHCNICAALVASNETSLYMLSCNHLLCKNCMQQTDHGTKCPICESAIKFINFSKLSVELKEKFQPDAMKDLKKRVNIIKFQHTQHSILAKIVQKYKMKAKKAAQYHAQMKTRVIKKKQMLDKLMEQRRLMQQQLKAIYEKNQKKKASQMYRQQISFSASTSSRISNNSINFSTPSFFNTDRNPHLAHQVASNSITFFQRHSWGRPTANGTRSSISIFEVEQQPRSILKRSKSSARSPFFA